MKYAFMVTHQREFRVTPMCKALSVSRSGYYAWRERPESQRSQANRVLVGQIKALHHKTREAYGAVMMWHLLRAQGIRCRLTGPLQRHFRYLSRAVNAGRIARHLARLQHGFLNFGAQGRGSGVIAVYLLRIGCVRH